MIILFNRPSCSGKTTLATALQAALPTPYLVCQNRGGRPSAVTAPVLQHDPQYRDDGGVRLVQTCGGRARSPAPRVVPHLPFLKVRSPSVWTTLALTIRPDGASEVELVGASAFPQHWVYDATGRLTCESDPPAYSTWSAHSFGPRTPWG